MPIFCQRGSGALCFPGFGSAHRLCRAAGLGVFLLSGLPHPGAAFLPDAHCGRFSLFGGVSAAGWLAAAPGRGVPGVVLCPNAAVLFQQYGHYQRCHLNHLCSLHLAGYPRGKPERLCPLPLWCSRRSAANLGSMATPIGNPQNLYLYSVADMGFAQFAWAVLPYTGISLVLLAVALLFQKDEPVREFASQAPGEKLPLPALAGNAVLPGLVLAGGVPGGGLPPGAGVRSPGDPFGGPAALWGQWITPCSSPSCVFSSSWAISSAFRRSTACCKAWWGDGSCGQASLQAKSSAMCLLPILLSGFTGSYGVLLTAVNLGGLGTPIASLASLISFKFCAREYPRPNGALLQDLHSVEPSLSGSAHRRCSPPYLTKRGSFFPFFA